MKVSTKCVQKGEMEFEEVVRMIRSGEHLQHFHEGDIIEIGGVEHVIIGRDVEEGFTHSMTIQRHNKIYDRRFGEGSNVYETSEIRAFLNGKYGEEFPEEFLKAVKPVTIDGMKTQDRFFLLSSDDLDPEKSKYPFYRKGRQSRTHYDEEGFAAWYWLRDPYTGSSSYVRNCYSYGAVNGYFGAYASDRGLSPACVIAQS